MELPPLGKVAAPVQARLQATRLEALQAAPVWPPLTVALPQRLETAGWAQQSPPHSVTLPPIGPYGTCSRPSGLWESEAHSAPVVAAVSIS